MLNKYPQNFKGLMLELDDAAVLAESALLKICFKQSKPGNARHFSVHRC